MCAVAGSVEIAGNDDILFTLISKEPDVAGAIHSFPRQGNSGIRNLVLLPVADLVEAQRLYPVEAVEHVHDY